MKYLLLLTLLLVGCSRSDGLEDGYYLTSIDKKADFFCASAYEITGGVRGDGCVDMKCEFAGDKRIRSTVFLKQAVTMRTKGFNYKLVPCGPKE